MRIFDICWIGLYTAVQLSRHQYQALWKINEILDGTKCFDISWAYWNNATGNVCFYSKLKVVQYKYWCFSYHTRKKQHFDLHHFEYCHFIIFLWNIGLYISVVCFSLLFLFLSNIFRKFFFSHFSFLPWHCWTAFFFFPPQAYIKDT